MPNVKKKPGFLETTEGIEIKNALQRMASDSAYMTESSYSANSVLYPNNLISFVDKHLNYLRAHPATDPQHYVSNLRLMTRLR
ncbi:MAG: hypothetical protein V4702_01640 [Patescibacteria group bacterium]